MSRRLDFGDPRDCSCPCHRGEDGCFHCWGPCCNEPDFIVVKNATTVEPDTDEEIVE